MGGTKDDLTGRAQKLREQHDVRSLRRESASGVDFELSYLRTGPFEGRSTVVVVPGGPGLGSVAPCGMIGIAVRRVLRIARQKL